MPRIFLLEDDQPRVDAMLEVLSTLGITAEVVVARDAPTMIASFHDTGRRPALICLDHDLLPLDDPEGGDSPDPGTGRDVADFLATISPCCPVLTHSTNHPAALGMEALLAEAGWRVDRLAPYDDLLWITEAWSRHVAKLLAEDAS